MNFTPKINLASAVTGILTVAAAGLIGWVNYATPPPAPIAATQNEFAVQDSFQTGRAAPVAPAILFQGSDLQTARPDYYQPVSSWYKSKRWWKKNAPIVGGAAGGALIGGLAGGGTGVVIGGAAGGGGGYLYKRLKHKNHHHYDKGYKNRK